MKYYLGIDGGGTKTRFLIGNESGKIESEYTGGSSHYLQCGLDGLTGLMRTGADMACDKAGLTRSDITCAFAGCAGYGDTEADRIPIENAIASGLEGIRVRAGNDCENALAGALPGRPGINVIAGTGAIAFGMNEGGDSARVGGWHHHLGGDEGSAYWIGWSMLKEFERQSDGRNDKTLLYDAVKKALDINTDDEMITRVVEEWDLDRTRIAGLAPLCADLYDQNDPYGKKITESAAAELADLAIAVRKHVRFDGTVMVSSTGGIFSMGERILSPFRSILKANGMEYVSPALPPSCGSVILAMQMDGVRISGALVKEMSSYKE
ncbi:MAG: ATPase [Firmicutes bacterium]|nr:ATPase [Bacillota bacterium]